VAEDDDTKADLRQHGEMLARLSHETLCTAKLVIGAMEVDPTGGQERGSCLEIDDLGIINGITQIPVPDWNVTEEVFRAVNILMQHDFLNVSAPLALMYDDLTVRGGGR
jgi:hypothetical protein